MDGISNPTSPTLPVELLHEILLSLNGASLKACTQVSKTWLHASRTHLFRKLAHNVHLERHRVVSQADGAPVPLQDLLEYLEDAPAVCGYIQQLDLRIPRQRPLAALGVNHESELHLCRFETLIDILARLPHLSTLVVDGIPFHTPESPRDVRPLVDSPVVSSLKKLSIRSWWRTGIPAHADNLLHLLSLFGEVDLLYLGAIRFLPQPATASLTASVQAHIHELHFHSADALNAIIQLPNLWQLSSLKMPIIARTDAAITTRLTRAARHNLRHLDMKLHEPIMPLMPVPHDLSYLDTLELASCTQLETLSITVCVYNIASPPCPQLVGLTTHAGFYEPAYTYLTGLLAALPSTLSSLSFTLYNCTADLTFSRDRTPTVVGPILADWTALDRVLADRVAKNGLQSIEFKDIRGNCLSVTERMHIMETLPETWSSGKVQFQQPD